MPPNRAVILLLLVSFVGSGRKPAFHRARVLLGLHFGGVGKNEPRQRVGVPLPRLPQRVAGAAGLHRAHQIHEGHRAFVRLLDADVILPRRTRRLQNVRRRRDFFGGRRQNVFLAHGPQADRCGAAHKHIAGGEQGVVGVARVDGADGLIGTLFAVLLEDFPAGPLGVGVLGHGDSFWGRGGGGDVAGWPPSPALCAYPPPQGERVNCA